MKEKSFKFREFYANIVKSMNDFQAGVLLKNVCEYVFHKHELASDDAVIQIGFNVMKSAIDAEERDRENGKRGAVASAEKRKKSECGVTCVTEIMISAAEKEREGISNSVAKK